MTFSIVARSADGQSWGVAVASKFLAVGSAVPAAATGAGALATQAAANVAYKRDGLALLAGGATAEEALRRLIADDDGREERQLGIVDAAGRSATFTGSGCLDWAGGVARDGYAMQGNILVGPQVLAAMESAWLESGSDEPLGRRLLTALAAGDTAGGDARGRQSAAVFVVRSGAGYGGFDDTAVDLRVDDHPTPIAELTRLLDLNDLYLTASTEEERIQVTTGLRDELEAGATTLGARDFASWVGTENYEMRVAEDGSWLDTRVLRIFRDGVAAVTPDRGA